MSEQAQSFSAPWDSTLRRVTLVIALVCLAITASLWPVMQAEGITSMHFWGGLLPTLIALGCAVLQVKGYRLEDGDLVVERRLWVKRFPLSELESVQPEPQLMRQSNSLLGNSGFFGFMGLFKHSATGTFRAFVTDPSQTLLLRFPQRAIAISPGDQERFLAGLQAQGASWEQLPSKLGGASGR